MSSTAVVGVSCGLGLVLVIWLLVRRSEKRHQERKLELLRRRHERRRREAGDRG